MNATHVISTPLRYLDKALNGLRDLGLMPEKPDEMPVVALINQISDLDEEKTIAIARTLSNTTVFNEVVREQITRFVANTGRLTAIGLVVLVITALMLLSTIEEACNVIWRQSESRGFGARFLTYWAILTLTPLLIGGSFAVSSYIFAVTEVMKLEFVAGPLGFALRLLPFLLMKRARLYLIVCHLFQYHLQMYLSTAAQAK